LALALHGYHDAYDAFPAGTIIHYKGGSQCNGSDCRGVSMYVVMLPFVEEENIENTYNYSAPHGWIGNSSTFNSYSAPGFFLCPSNGVWSQFDSRRDYFGVSGGKKLKAHGWRGDIFEDGVFYLNSFIRFADITDGTSTTFAMGEGIHASKWGAGDGYGKADQGGPATWWFGGGTSLNNPDRLSVGRVLRTVKHPLNIDVRPIADDEDNEVPMGSGHPSGAQFAFSDAHVEFISDTIDFDTYQALGTRASSETVVNY
jgi:hypothetical protein